MNRTTLGIGLTLLVVLIEAVQFVYLGGLFQKMNTFQFGFLVFGLTSALIIGYLSVFNRAQISNVFSDLPTLIAINFAALMTFAAFLLSVQLIEPVITYTISSGVMPITTYFLYRVGWSEGDTFRSRGEIAGTLLILSSILFLAATTFAGFSGFVRGSAAAGIAGILLAIVDGIFFTMILVYSSRMQKNGIGPSAVLGFRIILYVFVSGGLFLASFDARPPLGFSSAALYIAIGFLLIVPPLFILQKAVGLASTLTMSAIFTLGPIFIFALQLMEGRVDFSVYTLAGLGIYSTGALMVAFGPLEARTSARKN